MFCQIKDWKTDKCRGAFLAERLVHSGMGMKTIIKS